MAVGIEKTRSELRTAFYDDADTDSNVIATSKVDELLQQAGVKLAWFVVRHSDQRVLYKATSVNTVADTAAITLPDNCLQIIALRYTHEDGTRCPIDPGGLDRLDMTDTNDSRDWTNTKPKYVFTGDTIEFDPKPEKIYAVNIHFIPSLPFRNAAGTAISKMTLDTDVVSMPWEWHRYLTLTAAAMFLDRRREDSAAIKAELQDWATIIQDILGLNRQVGDPKKVRDVLGDGTLLEEDWAGQIMTS